MIPGNPTKHSSVNVHRMGIQERKSRERESMRASILDAAMELYLEEGLDSLSIRKIADKIEFSPATIYLYYRDKDEIFYDLYSLAFGQFLTEQHKLDGIADPYDRLYAGCQQYIQWGLANPKLYDLMFILQVPMTVIAEENCKDIGQASFNVLRQTVSQCIAAGKLRVKDVELASLMIWNMLHGIVSLIIKQRVLVPAEAVDGIVTAMLDSFLLLLKR